MTFPIPNYTRVKVRGRLVSLARASRNESSYGLTAPVQFIPTPLVAINQSSNQIIEMDPFVVFPRASDGYFEILLPSTDDPDVVPVDWNYKVVEPTGRTYHIVVPHDTPRIADSRDPDHNTQTIDLVDIVPDPEDRAGTIQLLHGRAGRGVQTVTISSASRLVGTFSDGATWDAGLLPVASVNGKTGQIEITRADLGLGNVNNTTDAAKPISNATQAALNNKENSGTAATLVNNHVNAADPHSQYLTESRGDARYVQSSGGGSGAPAAHTHSAADITSGRLDAARLPDVMSTTNAFTGVTGNRAINAGLAGNFYDYSCTGNVTFGVPSNPTNHQVIHITALAQNAQRTIGFAAGYEIESGLSRSYTVPNGKVLRAAAEYIGLTGVWLVTAAVVSP